MCVTSTTILENNQQYQKEKKVLFHGDDLQHSENRQKTILIEIVELVPDNLFCIFLGSEIQCCSQKHDTSSIDLGSWDGHIDTQVSIPVGGYFGINTFFKKKNIAIPLR